MTPYDIDIWIQKYAEGRLSPSERETFAQELQKDPLLQQQLEDYTRIHTLIREQKLLQIKNIAARTHARQQKVALRTKIIATAIALGILATAWLAYRTYEEHRSAVVPIQVPMIQKDTLAQTNAEPVTTLPPKSAAKPAELVQRSLQLPEKTSGLSAPDTLPRSRLQAEPPQRRESHPTLASTPIAQRPSPRDSTSKGDVCAHVLLRAELHMTPACVGGNDGALSIGQAQGGQAPYAIQVTDAQKNILAQTSALAAGTYEILLTDARHCNSIQKITVTEKSCPLHYSFNPFLGESWEIPHKDKKGLLKIVDKKGNLYFSRNLTPTDSMFWDGKPNNGEVKAGYYLFYIQHEDNTMTSGSVTIIE